MSNNNKFRNFFKHLWYELEPIISEVIIYSIVIFVVAIAAYFTEPYLDEKLKDAVHQIKWIFVVGALGLFTAHTLVKIFIRMIVGIVKETKDGIDEIKKPDKPDKKDTLKLNEPSANFDDIEDFKAEELKQSVKRKRNEQ